MFVYPIGLALWAYGCSLFLDSFVQRFEFVLKVGLLEVLLLLGHERPEIVISFDERWHD